jgi:hypothetical protein
MIVVVVICLMALVVTARARAQEEPAPAPDDAHASVEASLSVAPQLLIARLLPSSASGALGGLGSGSSGLGNLGDVWFPLTIDVAFALAPSAFFAVGLSGSYSEVSEASSLAVSIPLSVLLYLEEPRVGRVLPTLRVGGTFGYYVSANAVDRTEVVAGNLFARGGLTWMAARWIALRAEIGLVGGVTASLSGWSYAYGSIGFDGSLAVVLRV